MGIFNSEKSYIVPTVFSPADVGMYAIYPPEEESYFTSHFDTCREQFAKKFLPDSKGFFLSVENLQLKNVPNFISICEDLLEIQDPSQFFTTDMNYVIFIMPSPFWKDCYMKRSLFTLLCRLGIYFQESNNFENHLFGNLGIVNKDKINTSYAFARKTKDAMMRFFSGHNYYVGNGPNMQECYPEKHGWVVEFQEKSLEYVKKVLVRKNSTNYFFFGRNLFLT